ncbi:MAG TPA: MFS transporter [Verrucomicrobiae bacterium]|nr:MFS transporter [Verrucomicrobiae bacterium]
MVGGSDAALWRARWITLAAAFLGWMFDGVEIGLFPLVARPALQELLADMGDADVGRWIGVITACFLLGAALGGLVFGWLGDRIGRVRAMVISILMYSLFTGAGFFATTAWHLGLFRFIASLGMGGEWAVAVALVVECWPEQYRPRLAGAIGAAANVGTLFIGVVASIFPVTADSWRWMMLVGAAPAALALLVVFFVPESERWKASRQTAKKQPIVEIFGKGMRKRTVLAIVFSAIPLVGTWAAVSGWIPSWVEQMTQARLVAKELPGGKIETQAGLLSGHELNARLKEAKAQLPQETWGQIATASARAKANVQILLATGAVVGCFLAPLIGGWWGRRPVYFGLCVLSLLSCGWLFGHLDMSDGLTFWVVAWVVGGLTAAFYGWLPLYLPELFPTRVRATGQGLSFNFGRILAAVGTLYMGELVRLLGGDYGGAMAKITLVYLLGMALIWLAPETKGKPLPE